MLSSKASPRSLQVGGKSGVAKMDADDPFHIPHLLDRRTPEEINKSGDVVDHLVLDAPTYDESDNSKIQGTQPTSINQANAIMGAQVTVVTAAKPKDLSKGYFLLEGELRKRPGGVLVKGKAMVIPLPNGLTDLKIVLMELRSPQALIYGVPKEHSSIRLMSSEEWHKEGCPSDAIPRTKEHFEWSDGPGIMMLDYDPGDGQGVLNRDELVRTIRDAVPALKKVKMLWVPSASSHIVNSDTGEDLTGLKGQRLYLIADDARDIPRAGKALVESLWAAGHGRIEASKSGQLLERTIVDAFVWQPNRLDFAAGAHCEPPLYQDRGEPIIIPEEV